MALRFGDLVFVARPRASVLHSCGLSGTASIILIALRLKTRHRKIDSVEGLMGEVGLDNQKLKEGVESDLGPGRPG